MAEPASNEAVTAALEKLEEIMNSAILKNIDMQEKGIKYQEHITAVNVQLAQVAARASKQVPQG